MKRPSTRVIRQNLDGDVRAARNEDHVAALGIAGVGRGGAVPGPGALVEDEEVVAGEIGWAFDYEAGLKYVSWRYFSFF